MNKIPHIIVGSINRIIQDEIFGVEDREIIDVEYEDITEETKEIESETKNEE